MSFEKSLSAIFLFLSFVSFAQKLELSFEVPVELAAQKDYTVSLEYFDHTEKKVKTKYPFLEDRKSLACDFNQVFPVEVNVSFKFKGAFLEFPLLLRPGNTLKIHLNQLVGDSVKAYHHPNFFEEFMTLKGKDADINKPLIAHHSMMEIDEFIYNRLFRKNGVDPKELWEKFKLITDLQFKGFSTRVDKLDIPLNKSTDYFRDYLKDKQRLQVARKALFAFEHNGLISKVDSLQYYQFIDELFHLNGNNDFIKEYYFAMDQIWLYGYSDPVGVQRFSAEESGFEQYMDSDAFVVRPQWEYLYQEMQSSEGSILTKVVSKLHLLRNGRPNRVEVESVMMNDLYFNGVSYGYYYRDSLFIDYVSKLGLSSEIKLNLLLRKMIEIDNRPLQEFDVLTNAADVLPYQMDNARRRLYLKAFEPYEAKEYKESIQFCSKRTVRLVEDGYFADSLPVMNSDQELYDFVRPKKSELSMVILFGETYDYSLEYKLAIMRKLREEHGEKLNLVVAIDWGRTEAKYIVNDIMQAIEDNDLSVNACIVNSELAVVQFNQYNKRFHKDYLMITSSGFMPRVKPRYDQMLGSSSYNERFLDRLYYENLKQANEDTIGKEPEDLKVEDIHIVSISEGVEQIINLEKSIFEKDFAAFFNDFFADGRGWYTISTEGSMILSKKKFQLVYSSEPVIWRVDNNRANLQVYGTRQDTLQEELDFKIDAERRSIFVDGVEYRMLFYDELLVVFELKKWP